MNKNIQFKIVITNKCKLQCSYIDSENTETMITLHNQQETIYPICISLYNEKIIICEQKGKTYYFMGKLFKEPNMFHLYTIYHRGIEYNVIAEVLFALIISEFKQQIEKEFIITETIVQLPVENSIVNTRIAISLEAIGLKEIKIGENEIIDFDYREQGKLLETLMEKKEEQQKYERMIYKAKGLSESDEQRNELTLSGEIINSEETFYKEILKYSTQEKEKIKLYKLDNYCIFIASRYFHTLNDHINLCFVCKRLQFNMEKFHYNPISLDNVSMKFFPNVETFHLYNSNDKYFSGGRIIKYVDWTRINYILAERLRKAKPETPIEFKCIIYPELKKEKKFN